VSPDGGLAGALGPYLATVVGFALAFLLLAYVLRRHERQSASIAWLLAIVLVPVVGVPAYLLFAGRKLAVKVRAKRDLQAVEAQRDAGLAGTGADIEQIVRGYGLSAASTGNRAELVTRGEDAYATLTELIDGARESIQITTFILGRDRVGRAIVARLARRAAEGVQVRLLVDALGSLGARLGLLSRLERSGGKVGVFMRALPVHGRWRANLRNHRKLAIFDGRVALAGGMNLARHYMGTGRSTSRWVDTLLRIEGPAVRDLASIFADDWEFATRERLPDLAEAEAGARGTQVLQVVPSGPDVPHDALLDAVVAAVYKARRRLWVVTPYFVPDDGLMRALLLQARLGSDVRVMLPRRSDNLAVDLARARFVRRLREAGARFFVHRERMLHAKHLLVDDALAIAGSANLDMRSLYLNYELALFGYDPLTVRVTERWMQQLLAECEEYRPREPGLLRRVAEDLCWLAAPLL